jgi:hypothetical protein
MMNGWLFGYIKALKIVDIESVIFCVSDRVTTTTRFYHRPTGAVICMLPATVLYKAVRRSRDFFHRFNFIGTYWIKAALRRATAILLLLSGLFG